MQLKDFSLRNLPSWGEFFSLMHDQTVEHWCCSQVSEKVPAFPEIIIPWSCFTRELF